MTETIESVTTTGAVLDEDAQRELAAQMVERARAAGIDLVGPGGLLTGLTKQVLEAALEEELSEHLGYDKPDPAGRNKENSRNGTRAKTVLTHVAPGALAADQFGLERGVECLGQGVIRVAGRADRGDRAGLGQPLGVANSEIVPSDPALECATRSPRTIGWPC